MTDVAAVRAAAPLAVCRREYAMGGRLSRWVVRDWFGGEILGYGNSPCSAWASAALTANQRSAAPPTGAGP
jgi:hypothetical protein